MHKLGLKLWSTNIGSYYDEATRLYQDHLFYYIELYIIPGSLDTLDKWARLKSTHGIPFIIHCPHSTHGFNLADKQKLSSNYNIYTQVKTFADTLKSPYIIFHGGMDGSIEETAKQLASFQEPRALLENKPQIPLPSPLNFRQCRGASISEITYVQHVTQCGFCLDFCHAACAANSTHQDIYTYMQALLQLNPQMFHLADKDDLLSPFDSHLHLGTGMFNLTKIKAMLPTDALVTLETEKCFKNNINDFIEDVKCMKN